MKKDIRLIGPEPFYKKEKSDFVYLVYTLLVICAVILVLMGGLIFVLQQNYLPDLTKNNFDKILVHGNGCVSVIKREGNDLRIERHCQYKIVCDVPKNESCWLFREKGITTIHIHDLEEIK